MIETHSITQPPLLFLPWSNKRPSSIVSTIYREEGKKSFLIQNWTENLYKESNCTSAFQLFDHIQNPLLSLGLAFWTQKNQKPQGKSVLCGLIEITFFYFPKVNHFFIWNWIPAHQNSFWNHFERDKKWWSWNSYFMLMISMKRKVCSTFRLKETKIENPRRRIKYIFSKTFRDTFKTFKGFSKHCHV